MGCNRIHFKQFFIVITIVLIFLSCDSKQNLPEYFKNREYEKIEAYLSSADLDWENALWQNKLFYESKRLKPIPPKQIFNLMKADELFDYSEFKRFYYKTSFHPFLFLRNLIEVENLFQLTIKSHYYHEVINILLRSKVKENRQFAYEKLLTDYHRRYHHIFYETLARMQLDTIYQKSFLDSLVAVAAQFERIEEIKSYQAKVDSNSFYNKLWKEKFIGKRFNREYEIAVENADKIDLYILDKKTNLLAHLRENETFRYRFILSGKKFNSSSFTELKGLIGDSTIKAIEKSEIIALLNIQNKDSLHYLFRYPLTTAVHRAIFEQIELNQYSDEILQSYLELFIQRKLQRSIEKEIKNCPKVILERFIRKRLSPDSENLSFLIYWVGIAKLSNFTKEIEQYIEHEDRIVSYQAEETLKRLN